MIMEAEKSPNLPSASWRPRKAGGVIQPESEGRRTRRAHGGSSSPRAEEGEMRRLRSSSEAGEEVNVSFFLLLVCAGPQWTGPCACMSGRTTYAAERP